MFSNNKRQALRQTVSPKRIIAEVGNLKAGEVLIVKTSPGIETCAQSTIEALLYGVDGRKVLVHSLDANTTKVVICCHCRQELEEPLLLLCEGKELNDDFVRKSIKGYCFKNVFDLDEELDRFESAFHNKTPFSTRQFVEQVHTQIGFLGDGTGFLRHYFGLGVKPESFRKAKTLAGSYFDLKSSISIISHLFMSVAEAYLKILHSNEEFMKESAKF